MKKKETKLLFGVLFFLICSCSNSEFTREKWHEKNDFIYVARKNIVEDLIKNHLNKNLCYEDLLELLGPKVTLSRRVNEEHIYFEIETKYGSNIDPRWIKYLEIELDNDSCYVEGRVIKR
jgi:hypothetical protein